MRYDEKVSKIAAICSRAVSMALTANDDKAGQLLQSKEDVEQVCSDSFNLLNLIWFFLIYFQIFFPTLPNIFEGLHKILREINFRHFGWPRFYWTLWLKLIEQSFQILSNHRWFQLQLLLYLTLISGLLRGNSGLNAAATWDHRNAFFGLVEWKPGLKNQATGGNCQGKGCSFGDSEEKSDPGCSKSGDCQWCGQQNSDEHSSCSKTNVGCNAGFDPINQLNHL